VADTIITSLIGAAGVVAGSVITVTVPQLFTRLDEKERYYSSRRSSIIAGVWNGVGNDFFTEDNSSSDTFTLKIDFHLKGRKISGIGELNETPAVLTFDGGFQDDSYLQLSYRSVDPSRRQMGVIMFRLAADGRTLKGYYAGFSPTREIS
jgi:hypothetical protein